MSKIHNIYIQKMEKVYKLVNIVMKNHFYEVTMVNRARYAPERDSFKNCIFMTKIGDI